MFAHALAHARYINNPSGSIHDKCYIGHFVPQRKFKLSLRTVADQQDFQFFLYVIGIATTRSCEILLISVFMYLVVLVFDTEAIYFDAQRNAIVDNLVQTQAHCFQLPFVPPVVLHQTVSLQWCYAFDDGDYKICRKVTIFIFLMIMTYL